MNSNNYAAAKEHKEEEAASVGGPSAKRRLNLINLLIGNCVCPGIPREPPRCSHPGDHNPFVELHGLCYIGLGAVCDELTPKERVYDTLEQLTTNTERLISIGYVVQRDDDGSPMAMTTESVPLEKNEEAIPKGVAHVIEQMKNKNFVSLKSELQRQLKLQMARPDVRNHKYLAGITAHNLGVLSVLASDDDAIGYFREAIRLKEAAFGRQDPQVALSWDELGIQFFANGDFEAALVAFREAHSVRTKQSSIAMTLNNMACCYFSMGDSRKALATLQEADEIQQAAPTTDLELLHVAIVICNIGYVKLALKQYDDARSDLEEALLIQQSVLDDNHRAVRDTLSNIELANAFHS